MQCPQCDKEMTIEEVDYGRGDESDLQDAWWCEDCRLAEYIEPDLGDESDGRDE